MQMQDFRQLVVWGRAHAFALAVRKCADDFPRAGYADFKAQLIRAAESIANNVVEGCGAATRKEFARYLDISIKSTSEVEGQLQLANDQGLIRQGAWDELSSEVIEIRKMLYGLRRALLAADAAEKRGRRRQKNGKRGNQRRRPERADGSRSQTPGPNKDSRLTGD